jgi:hypothetical protein
MDEMGSLIIEKEDIELKKSIPSYGIVFSRNNNGGASNEI